MIACLKMNVKICLKTTTWGIDSTHKIWWHDINVGSMLEERHFCVKGVWSLICWLALLKVIVWDVFFQYRYVQWNYETWDHTSPRLRIFGLLLVVVVCCLFSGVLWFLTWHLVEIPLGDSLQAFDLYKIYIISCSWKLRIDSPEFVLQYHHVHIP